MCGGLCERLPPEKGKESQPLVPSQPLPPRDAGKNELNLLLLQQPSLWETECSELQGSLNVINSANICWAVIMHQILGTQWLTGDRGRREEVRGLHRGPHTPLFFRSNTETQKQFICSIVMQPGSKRLNQGFQSQSWDNAPPSGWSDTKTCSGHSATCFQGQVESRWCFWPFK